MANSYYEDWNPPVIPASQALAALARTPLAPVNSLGGLAGVDPAAFAPSDRPIDVGAQVGIVRNLEFSAGDRCHRVSMGSYTKS